MKSVARFRMIAVVASCVALLILGVGFYLLSKGVVGKRNVVYGFKIVARVTVENTSYFGEAYTRCTAHQKFPYLIIESDQQGQTLAIRLDQGKVLFVDFTRFTRNCHPADSLWKSARTATWDRFTGALADARREQRRIPIDLQRTGIYIADDATRPRQLTRLDAASQSALGPENHIDELYLQVVADPNPRADPSPQDFAAIFPWSRSVEHEVADPLQCYSFGWDHVVIEPASVPKFEVIESSLRASSSDRFVDLTDDLSTNQKAELLRLGKGNRVDLSEDRMTVHLSYPAIAPRLVRYMPGPTVPWQSPWRPRTAQPFGWPWNPRFCMSDGTCFQLAAGRETRTTLRYVLDRQTTILHRLHLAREAFWSNSFGTDLRHTQCEFD